MLFFFFFVLRVFMCQAIPEVPPKPGELQTELQGYKKREEAAAVLQTLQKQENVD